MRVQRYTTMDIVKQATKIETANANDDELLEWIIEQASGVVVQRTGRYFVPFVQTIKVPYTHQYNTRLLRVPGDLLAISSLTNGDGSALSSWTILGWHQLENEYPGAWIETDEGDEWSFTDRASRAVIAGTWGYHDAYNEAWDAVTTLSGDVADDAATTSVSVSDASDLEVGDTIRINAEQMFIESISGTTLTVQRGINSTTRAAHTTSDDIERWLMVEQIEWATTELAGWLYKNRDRVNEYIQFANGGGVRIGDINPAILETIDAYKREVIQRGGY